MHAAIMLMLQLMSQHKETNISTEKSQQMHGIGRVKRALLSFPGATGENRGEGSRWGQGCPEKDGRAHHNCQENHIS